MFTRSFLLKILLLDFMNIALSYCYSRFRLSRVVTAHSFFFLLITPSPTPSLCLNLQLVPQVTRSSFSLLIFLEAHHSKDCQWRDWACNRFVYTTPVPSNWLIAVFCALLVRNNYSGRVTAIQSLQINSEWGECGWTQITLRLSPLLYFAPFEQLWFALIAFLQIKLFPA